MTTLNVGTGCLFPTLQAAFDSLIGQHCGPVTMQLANEKHTTPLVVNQSMFSPCITVQGPAEIEVTGTHAIHTKECSIPKLVLKDLSVKVLGSVGYGVQHEAVGWLIVDGVEFRRVPYAQLKAKGSGVNIKVLSATLNGGCLIGMEARESAFLIVTGPVACGASQWVGSGNGNGVVVASRHGVVDLAAASWSGSATGRRYSAYSDGLIWTNGGSGLPPGTAAGQAYDGGRVD